MISMRLMGKRQLGDVEPTELVVTILISEMASLPMQDPEIPVIYALIPILLLVCFEIITSAISLKSMKLRRFFQGRYSILIADGKIDQREMKRLHLTVDELLEELRQKGAMSVDEVRFCIMETSGQMSVLLKNDSPPCDIPVSLVIDGQIIKRNVKKANLNEKAVIDYLNNKRISIKDVFWLSFVNGEFCLTEKDQA